MSVASECQQRVISKLEIYDAFLFAIVSRNAASVGERPSRVFMIGGKVEYFDGEFPAIVSGVSLAQSAEHRHSVEIEALNDGALELHVRDHVGDDVRSNVSYLLQIPNANVSLPISRHHLVTLPIRHQASHLRPAFLHGLETFAGGDIPQLDASIDRSRNQQTSVERGDAGDGVALQRPQMQLRLQAPDADRVIRNDDCVTRVELDGSDQTASHAKSGLDHRGFRGFLVRRLQHPQRRRMISGSDHQFAVVSRPQDQDAQSMRQLVDVTVSLPIPHDHDAVVVAHEQKLIRNLNARDFLSVEIVVVAFEIERELAVNSESASMRRSEISTLLDVSHRHFGAEISRGEDESVR